ncbi:hypothetical protein PTKIN_Ptkin18bG0049300 [Pterospermum kingtungense]
MQSNSLEKSQWLNLIDYPVKLLVLLMFLLTLRLCLKVWKSRVRLLSRTPTEPHLVRLLPHFYDYIRVPVPNPWFAEDDEFVNPMSSDIYSNFGDVGIPVTAIFLAAAVHCQQRWTYEHLSQILTVRQLRLLLARSKVYERCLRSC